MAIFSKTKKVSAGRLKGFALIEVLVSTTAGIIILVSFITLAIQAKKISRINSEKLRATLYLREVIEIAKDLEISNWSEILDLSCEAPLSCHPEIIAVAWQFLASEEMLDSGFFRRSLSIFPVYRNQLAFPNEIVLTGGVLDPDTKKVTAIINWTDEFGAKTMNLETYVHKP